MDDSDTKLMRQSRREPKPSKNSSLMPTFTRRQLIYSVVTVVIIAVVIAGVLSLLTGRFSDTQGKGNPPMKYFGVVYDVGLRFTPGQPYSVEPFSQELVRYDMETIAKSLHANAVRIEGEEIERLVFAARAAHALGLAIMFNPWMMNVPVGELPAYFAKAARAAEELRKDGVDLIFVAGCEMTMFNEGIFPGKSLNERMSWMMSVVGTNSVDEIGKIMAEKSEELNVVLRQISQAVGAEFKGSVTYSSGPWETVDWSSFNIVGVDYYRHNETADEYVTGLHRFRTGKPLVVMEVGCCAYKGAAVRGAYCFGLLEGTNPDGTGKFAGGVVPTRSEKEQADYVEEQLTLLMEAGVDGVFIYVFSFPVFRYGEGARDLDMMSFSLVKTFPNDDPRSKQIPPWKTKEAFSRIARLYRSYKANA